MRVCPRVSVSRLPGRREEVVDLSTDPEALTRLKAAGYLQAPVVETVDQSWSGFRPDKIDDVAKKRAAR